MIITPLSFFHFLSQKENILVHPILKNKEKVAGAGWIFVSFDIIVVIGCTWKTRHMLTRRCCSARVLHKYTTVTCATCRNTAGLTWQAMFCVRGLASSVTFSNFIWASANICFTAKKSESNIFFILGKLYFTC